MNNAPVSPEVARAALILSRECLKNRDSASEALARLDDGVELIALATGMYSLPMVAKHLKDLQPAWFNPQMTKQLELSFTLSHFVLRSELIAFHRRCIAPDNLEHAYIKGSALAEVFFNRPALRYARDIDVIVSRGDLPRIVNSAREAGYTILNSLDATRNLEDEAGIQAAIRYQKVISLVSPMGRHIEVHWKIDKDQGLFDELQLLRDADEVVLDGLVISTLQPVDHFIYVAYHCARHNWSKLHWLADLDAMASSPLVPHGQLLDKAESLGLKGLIDETLAFVHLSGHLEVVPPGRLGARILDRVMDILLNGDERRIEFANSQVATALPFPDLLSPSLRCRMKINRLWGRLSPQVSDYQAWPLPEQWQWVYRVTGPIGRMLRRGKS
ncbi:MAG: putative nucleotidyltransferase [Halomonas sp. HL-93]|nr:MAG: putative nucleotidyltransferase [Halomonas sp. HL-93]